MQAARHQPTYILHPNTKKDFKIRKKIFQWISSKEEVTVCVGVHTGIKSGPEGTILLDL